MSIVKWALDPTHSEIQFKVKHLMITNVTGTFNSFEGTAESEEEDFANAKVSFSADINSLTTNNTDRDNHLKSADFFDAENHPKLTFVAKRMQSVDNDGSYELFGDLTVHGITKEVELSVEFNGIAKDPWGNVKAGFDINGKINRKDFGLNWNVALEAGGVLVSEDVRIHAHVQFVKLG